MMSFRLWLAEAAQSRLYAQLMALRPRIAQAAQQIYDSWEQDDECDMGGICDEIASEIGSIIHSAIPGVQTSDGGHDGDDHAWVIAHDTMKAYGVDIPPHVYETGGGYCWQKIPDVHFDADDVEIWDLGLSPGQIAQHHM
jgi:hypothetical protein